MNLIFTASGWTREYTVYTLSPITRTKEDKPIQTGKVLVTCVESIPGVGTHSGSGEEWADDENAMTSAESVATKESEVIKNLDARVREIRKEHGMTQRVVACRMKRHSFQPRLGTTRRIQFLVFGGSRRSKWTRPPASPAMN
jgi:hypothetical protein